MDYTALDLWRERREQKKILDDYYGDNIEIIKSRMRERNHVVVKKEDERKDG